ncbi:protein FAM13A-like isoform X2 [Conger conger]|uniref:protein FAM13A-like isoform X2 n=1 Tax=Conger conger TaxID=82655 RepID=UPI002A59BD85|nr:protein FAM13A-like isoform X2 [Conger conger]
MKIQEGPCVCDMRKAQRSPEGAGFEDDSPHSLPHLDLADHRGWGDPVPAYLSWQREGEEQEEARHSPQAGGLLIRQLLEEESDPMVSPRFYAFGSLEDTEVPPSPPNSHSFMRRQRSWSLGSTEDDRRDMIPAQASKKIHNLKRKIRKFEERFEDEHKYRPSHSDKADNPEVLKWMNDLSKLIKDVKEHKLRASEEDLTPLVRQRSNTLPKSFGSQLERRPQEKSAKPPAESTLEALQSKLQEGREEDGRPAEVKDMTREQIGAEKLALQKALLYYESIHGKPVTKNERLVMRPLYDRYRLVKQVLSRPSVIPVIVEEDGSDEGDEGDSQIEIPGTSKPEYHMLGFLDQLEEDLHGFVSPADELSPTKHSTDMGLSNLHSASMPELVEQLLQAREEKKIIRKKLRDFEDTFFRQNGRNVQKEDRPAMADDYSEYKHVKAKLKLLEVLISKRDSSNLSM